MKTRILLACAATTVTLLYGCATQTTENSQMPVKANDAPVAQASNNANTSSTAEMKVADNSAANTTEGGCHIKGEKVTLNGMPIGISIEVGYCPSNLKPEGSDFWIPENDVPALGNIRVEDQCNITYCPTAPHYDHFNISDGTNVLQVQVKWEDNKPIIF